MMEYILYCIFFSLQNTGVGWNVLVIWKCNVLCYCVQKWVYFSGSQLFCIYDPINLTNFSWDPTDATKINNGYKLHKNTDFW